MDSKLTLHLDAHVIKSAKKYAANNNISVSGLVEFLLRKATDANIHSLEDYPVADWVNQLAEGASDYGVKKRSRKNLKDEYFSSLK